MRLSLEVRKNVFNIVPAIKKVMQIEEDMKIQTATITNLMC
jgi:hypothetical protein